MWYDSDGRCDCGFEVRNDITMHGHVTTHDALEFWTIF
jgi:hypothetical protein